MATNGIVIVGGGLAGATAAEELRDRGYDGPIHLFGAEPHNPYIRPPLSKEYFTGKDGRDSVFVHPETWYREKKIVVTTGERVDERRRPCRHPGRRPRGPVRPPAAGHRGHAPPSRRPRSGRPRHPSPAHDRGQRDPARRARRGRPSGRLRRVGMDRARARRRGSRLRQRCHRRRTGEDPARRAARRRAGHDVPRAARAERRHVPPRDERARLHPERRAGRAASRPTRARSPPTSWSSASARHPTPRSPRRPASRSPSLRTAAASWSTSTWRRVLRMCSPPVTSPTRSIP